MIQNPGLFEQLYREYGVLVFNMALHYVQHTEEAEEITQDVFVKIHTSLDRFNRKSSYKTWIYRITINQCLDHIRKRNSRKHYFVFGKKSQNEREYLNAPTFDHPGILMENKEEAALLFEVVNTLTVQQKTAFLLSKLDGLGNQEIAGIMAISVSAVESLIFRAKADLRQKLGEKFENYRKKK